MARDYLALQNECLQFGYSTAREGPLFKTWLNEASWDVATRHEWRWLDQTSATSTVAGVNTITVPLSTVMFPKRLRPVAAGQIEPEYVPWDSFADRFQRYPVTTARGVPSAYSFYDDQLIFDPVPDAVYNYTMICQGVPLAMSADTDEPWMPTEHRGVLVSGAMVKMAARDKDFQAVQFWQDQYEGQISKMRMANARVDSGRPHKIPMPRSYGWRD